MKKFALIAVLFLMSSTAYCEALSEVERTLDGYENASYSDEDGTEMAAPSTKYSFKAGPEYMWYHYEEPTIDIEDKGHFFGLNTAFSAQSEESDLLGRLEGRFLYGRVEYDGSLSSGTPFTTEGDDYIVELRAIGAKNLKLDNFVLRPFFGLGYRYLNDQLETQYAYEREISYLYGPLGLEVEQELDNDWSWGAHFEYDIFYSGVVKSHFSDVNPSFNDLRNNQNDGYGAGASIFIKKNLNEYSSFMLEPFIRYWDIEDSDDTLVTFAGAVIGTGREPENNTTEIGIRALFVW